MRRSLSGMVKRASGRLGRWAVGAAIAAGLPLALSGCNTARGIVYDVEAVGDAGDAFIDELTRERPAHSMWR